LEPLILIESRKKVPAKLAKNSKIYKTIIKAIQDKKGEHIVSLDLRKINESVSDFFIICTAGSGPQCKAIIDNIEDQVLAVCGEAPFKQEGRQSLQWVLIDYVNIVVHVMQSATRNFYNLEEMWSDAEVSGHDD
jgi:ribosome-associated protein